MFASFCLQFVYIYYTLRSKNVIKPKSCKVKSVKKSKAAIFSQPDCNIPQQNDSNKILVQMKSESGYVSFSQPHNNCEDFFIQNDQQYDKIISQFTQTSDEEFNGLEGFVQRMTRIFFENDIETITKALMKIFDLLQITVHGSSNNTVI